MAAVEKWAGFGGRQLFSERTQLYGFFALRSEDRFQPDPACQHQRLPIFKNERRQWWPGNSGRASLAAIRQWFDGDSTYTFVFVKNTQTKRKHAQGGLLNRSKSD
jgi:hypothetical protein